MKYKFSHGISVFIGEKKKKRKEKRKWYRILTKKRIINPYEPLFYTPFLKINDLCENLYVVEIIKKILKML